MRIVTMIVAAVMGLMASMATAQRSTPVRVTHPAGGASDQFGSAVAIDGDTMIVGAERDDVGVFADQGSAHVYRWTGTGWAYETTLLAAGGAQLDFFGTAVAISGDTAVVGARLDTVNGNFGQGSAYVFTRSGTTWTQQAQLNAPGGAAGDGFGNSVGVSGDTVIVGAFTDDVGSAVNQGSAWVFVRTNSTWSLQAQLSGSDSAANDLFGTAVAISGDTAVVGARDDVVAGNIGQGSATVFARTGTTWAQQAQLIALGGAVGDAFGSAVAISGQTVIVGAWNDDGPSGSDQGSASVFTRSGAAWTPQGQLLAPGIFANDRMGVSVAISGDLAVAGASYADVGALSDAGTAWVFSRVGSRWIGPDVSLLATGGASDDRFGYSVAISGNTAIVGATFDDVGANVNQGSAYIFTRTGSTWTQQAQLTATGGAANDFFGYFVAISGDTAIVGAPNDDVGSNADQGSAYVFTRTGSTWTQQAQLTATGGEASDSFGFSVAVSGDTAVVGAYGDDVGANADQGSAYVFVRTGTTWTQQVQLTATGSASNDLFGNAVAISGDTAIVGASYDTVGANQVQGSAYVFTRTGTTWTQQAQLTATGGAAFDYFGYSVAIAGDTAIVGASGDDVGASVDQGSAYVFTRAGTTWTQQAQLTAMGGAASDLFGASVAISGETAIVGATNDNGNSNFYEGSASTFDLAADDWAVAHNNVTAAASPSLAAALLPAVSGQQITATEAAWRGVGSLNTFGRSLGLFGSGDVRVPSTSVIDVGGSSALSAAPGSVVDLFGQLRVSGYVNLEGDAFRLGSRGILTTRTASSLSINAPVATIDGQVRIEQGASLTAAGDWTNIGPVTMSQDASFTAGGLLRNIDAWTMGAGARAAAGTQIDNRSTWTMTAGELMGPLVNNLGAFNVFGTSAIFGRFTNNTGATTTVRSGALFVFGDLVNNGTVIGTICSTCSGLPPAMDVGGTLSLGPSANLTMPFAGSVVRVGGSFESRISSNTRFDMAMATLQMESDRPEVTLEVMSRDIGVDPAGLDRTLAGHFPIGELHIGGHPTTVRLEDAADNARDGGDACEALYVDTLRIDAGSRLVNERCRIYYNTLINDGTVDVPANLIPLQGTQPCPADFNQDGGVDGGDVDAFFVAWESGDSAADVNQDGGVDGGDIDVFFAAWEAGGC